MDHRNTRCRRSSRVDVVQAGSASSHHLQIREGCDDRAIDLPSSTRDDRSHTMPVLSRVEGSQILDQLHGVGRLEDALRVGMHRFEEEDHGGAGQLDR